MSIVAFDTLKFIEKLEAAGIARSHAKATAEAVAEGFVAAELADKDDIAALEAELKAAFKSGLDGLRAEYERRSVLTEQRMAIRFGGMLVVAAGVLLVAFRYLLGH